MAPPTPSDLTRLLQAWHEGRDDALDDELDRALTRLEDLDPRQGRLVELRFFGGLSIAQTAEALGVSPATVKDSVRKTAVSGPFGGRRTEKMAASSPFGGRRQAAAASGRNPYFCVA